MAPHREPLRGHDWVRAVAVGKLDDHPVVISGGEGGTLRAWRVAATGVWQPGDGGGQQVIDLGSAVRAVAFASPRHVLAGTAMGIAVLRLGDAGPGAGGRYDDVRLGYGRPAPWPRGWPS
jgi:hypothetical protein